MSDKWIRFNKGLLIFSMITCLFSVIILTAFLADDKRLGSNAWIVFISGLLAVMCLDTHSDKTASIWPVLMGVS